MRGKEGIEIITGMNIKFKARERGGNGKEKRNAKIKKLGRGNGKKYK